MPQSCSSRFMCRAREGRAGRALQLWPNPSAASPAGAASLPPAWTFPRGTAVHLNSLALPGCSQGCGSPCSELCGDGHVLRPACVPLVLVSCPLPPQHVVPRAERPWWGPESPGTNIGLSFCLLIWERNISLLTVPCECFPKLETWAFCF